MNAFIERNFKVLLIIVIAVNFLIKFVVLDKYSYWSDFDEYYTATTATGFYYHKVSKHQYVNIDEIQSTTIQDRIDDAARDGGNSFSYNFLLYLTSRVFGESEFSFRMLSFAFHIISILLVVSIGRRLEIKKDRLLIAAIIFSLFPILFSFSSVIRAYSFGVMITLLFVDNLISLGNSTSPIRIVVTIAALTVLLFTTHYLAYYIPLFFFIYYLIKRRDSLLLYNRILIGLIVGGITSVIFLFCSSGLSDFTEKSKTNKSHAESKDLTLNTRNVKSLSMANLFETLPSYLNRYYLGDRVIPWFAKKFGGSKLELIASILCLSLPLVFLMNLERAGPNKRWLYMFIFLFLIGNVSAIVLSLISGHLMALNNVKYSIFTIPFFILTVVFFVKKNRLVVLASLAFIGLTAYSIYSMMVSQNVKMINVELPESGGRNAYAPSEFSYVKASVDKALSKVEGEIIYVRRAEDLVFIKNVATSFRFKTAYILEFDNNRVHQSKVVPIFFSVPN